MSNIDSPINDNWILTKCSKCGTSENISRIWALAVPNNQSYKTIEIKTNYDTCWDCLKSEINKR